MKQRNLTVLPPGCKELSYKERKRLGILPNRIVFLPDRAVVVEVVRSARGEDFAVNINAINYAAECERKLQAQGYIRGIDREEGAMIWQDTVGNYLRKINGLNPRPSENELFGPYHWIDDQGNPRVSDDMNYRADVDSPPWSMLS